MNAREARLKKVATNSPTQCELRLVAKKKKQAKNRCFSNLFLKRAKAQFNINTREDKLKK